MLYLFGLVLAYGFGVAIAALGGALGQGRAVSSAMEGIARQPEASGTIRTSLVIGLAFIESLVLYALVLGILLLGKLPDTKTILDILRTGGGH
jgi:F-type H+-transporting ATPase subunit c